MNKFKTFLRNYSISIGACVLTLIILGAWYVFANPTKTTIGDNINVVGNLTVDGNVNLGPGSILEVLNNQADGSAIEVASGTYTLENVTAMQTLTDSHAKVNGSLINYKPPQGASRVEYTYSFFWGLTGGTRSLFHIQLLIDGVAITPSRVSRMAYAVHDTDFMTFTHVINIGGTENLAQGRVGSWDTLRELKLTARRYSASYPTQLNHIYWWDGGASSDIRVPTLKITAYR